MSTVPSAKSQPPTIFEPFIVSLFLDNVSSTLRGIKRLHRQILTDFLGV